jgi:hypothetical protein
MINAISTNKEFKPALRRYYFQYLILLLGLTFFALILNYLIALPNGLHSYTIYPLLAFAIVSIIAPLSRFKQDREVIRVGQLLVENSAYSLPIDSVDVQKSLATDHNVWDKIFFQWKILSNGKDSIPVSKIFFSQTDFHQILKEIKIRQNAIAER